MAGSPAETIKEKLGIIEFIKGYLSLQASGKNFKALCPFHREKTPSFMVSPDRQSWHCFGCFPKGSLVKTPEGFHPIDSLKTGDTVISGKGREKRILFVHRHMYDGDLVHIKTRKLGGEVSLTGDHRVFVIKGPKYKKIYKNYFRRIRDYEKLSPEKYFYKTSKYFPIREIFARDLSKGELLLYPINSDIQDLKSINLKKYLRRQFRLGPVPLELPSEIKLDENFLKLLGYWIAEGSNHRAYIRFSLGGHELEFAEEIRSLIREVFALKSSIHIRKGKKTGIEVTCCHAALADIFGNLCGKGAAQKHIPFELRYLPVKKQSLILDAIWKGDGTEFVRHRSHKTARSISTVSRTLAEQIVDILLRKSIYPSVAVHNPRIDENNVRHQESYNVTWGTNGEDRYSLVYHAEDGIKYWVLPIVSVRKGKFIDEVYNLTVQDDHSYVARNFAVANCGAGGDIFTFLMRYENLEFAEALRILAEKAGIELKRMSPADYKFFGLLYDLNEAAKEFYKRELLNFKPALSYLLERGLKKETIEEFELGFAPNSPDALNLHFINSGHSPDDTLRAGLAVKNERGGQFDRFRGRIMFPIKNAHGKTVGFTGRILPEFDTGQMGKYINSPETPIFVKSKLLYGFHKSKDFIREAKKVFLVEGQMDFLMSWQSGVKNVVASSGTALTGDHLGLVRRLTDEVIINFDNDEAGWNAGERAIDLAQSLDFNVKVVLLKDFKDAAEAAEASPENFRQAVIGAKPAEEFYFEKYLTPGPVDPSDRRKLTNLRVVLAKIKNIPSPVSQSFWFKELSKRTGLSEKVLAEESEKLAIKTPLSAAGEGAPEVELASRKLTRWELICERLLSAVFQKNNFELVTESASELTPEYRDVLAVLKNGGKNNSNPDLDKLINLIVLRSEELSDQEINDLRVHLRREYLKGKRQELTQKVKQAEVSNDEISLKSALEELEALSRTS